MKNAPLSRGISTQAASRLFTQPASGPFVIESKSALAYLLPLSSSFASFGSEAPWLDDSSPVRV
ncbi:hypothetical protein QFZ83_001110 [Variovorax sp. W1I1]|nr:hypothetical protein [Variovorax sp. W1I1]